MSSRLVIIGSGETSPTMVKVHRDLLASTPDGPSIMLDTPFGFQVNADDLTDKIRGYFRESVGRDLEPARWRRRDEPATERERTLSLINRSTFAFAGPGSPSYALRQWQDTPVTRGLIGVAERGGTLVVGSAAAVTLGEFAIPVYEIYKVGADPSWETGLDLLGQLTGLRAAVIPHYDNREGGRHDTRFCYLGVQRRDLMEEMLPDDVGILGVDEHTAVVFDLTTRRADVQGAGGLTLRHRDHEIVIPSGESIDLDAVASHLRGDGQHAGVAIAVSTNVTPVVDEAAPVTSLPVVAQRREREFRDRLDHGDADGALAEALALEEEIHAWSADTLQGSDLDVARTTLRGMLVALAGAAESGLRDEADVIGPYIDIALDVRARARAAKDFAMSDAVRDALANVGIEVRDTPEGATWERSAD